MNLLRTALSSPGGCGIIAPNRIRRRVSSSPATGPSCLPSLKWLIRLTARCLLRDGYVQEDVSPEKMDENLPTHNIKKLADRLDRYMRLPRSAVRIEEFSPQAGLAVFCHSRPLGQVVQSTASELP